MEEFKNEEVKVEEKPRFEKKKKVDVEKFKARKLKNINYMKNKVKAKFNAAQVLKNK